MLYFGLGFDAMPTCSVPRREHVPRLAILLLLCVARGSAVELEQLTLSAETGSSWCIEPVWSPDGARIAYTHATLGTDNKFVSVIAVLDIERGEETILAGQSVRSTHLLNSHPGWAPDGERLVFSNPAGIWIANPSSDSARVIVRGQKGATAPVWSPTGDRIAFESDASGRRDIWFVPSQGGDPVRLPEEGAMRTGAAWSPDGERIAYAWQQSGNHDLWIVRTDGGYARRLTRHVGEDRMPSWSPDGRLIAFVSNRTGNDEIWIVPAEGGEPTQITRNPAEDVDPHWSPDGSRIVFASRRSGEQQIWVASDLPPASLVQRSWSPLKKVDR
ncbi:MAG: PD40 domain-containing protein [Candidatus Latescibacterota bacterium]|nr:MAG: PD40 domain-containing protein [Candidatus Latescibacterota bacterium]